MKNVLIKKGTFIYKKQKTLYFCELKLISFFFALLKMCGQKNKKSYLKKQSFFFEKKNSNRFGGVYSHPKDGGPKKFYDF